MQNNNSFVMFKKDMSEQPQTCSKVENREFFKYKNKCRVTYQGCILNLKFIFPPTPFLDSYFFPQGNLIIMRWCAPHAKNVKLFFGNFVNIKSIGEKICLLFTNWGKKNAFPPFFSSPFNNFFPPTWYFAIFLPPGVGGSNRKIYTPVTYLIAICFFFMKLYKILLFAAGLGSRQIFFPAPAPAPAPDYWLSLPKYSFPHKLR